MHDVLVVGMVRRGGRRRCYPGLQWALADLLLDQFGSFPDSLTRVEPSEVERPASDRSESRRSPFKPQASEPRSTRAARRAITHGGIRTR